jgi:hypothetical protein
MKPALTQDELRRHYAATAFARMGIEYERAMAVDAVRLAVEGAAMDALVRGALREAA